MQILCLPPFRNYPDFKDRILFSHAEFFQPKYSGGQNGFGDEILGDIGDRRDLPFRFSFEDDLGESPIFDIQRDADKFGVRKVVRDQTC